VTLLPRLQKQHDNDCYHASSMTTGEDGSGGLVPGHDSALAPVDEPLRRLVAGWLLGLASVNTRRSYSNDIAGWLAFCTDYGVDPLTARRTHVDAWARSLEAAGLRPRTIARRLASVVELVPLPRRRRGPVHLAHRPRTPASGPRPGRDTRADQRRAPTAPDRRGGARKCPQRGSADAARHHRPTHR